MFEIVQYTEKYKAAWDECAKNSKNGHFMFCRDYMEYHADRFIDHSLLFFEQSDLVAILPASKHDDSLISHGGLTFGGFVVDKKIKASQMLEIFSVLKTYLSEQQFKELRYKTIPHIYHQTPAEEDLYALFMNDATLVRRDISSTIRLKNKMSLSGGKKNGLAKAKKNGITIAESQDFSHFNSILNEVLRSKYGTQATHATDEIVLLANRFPQNISLFGAFKDNDMVAGVVMYVTSTVAHTQYMATTEVGRETGALDFLLSILINDIYVDKRYFDFGISTEQQGKYLNVGLISQKEMFGARAVVYDTYQILV